MEKPESRVDGSLKTEALGTQLSVTLNQGTLVVIHGQQSGRTTALESGSLVIGSDPGCDFRLSDRGVSKRHAQLSSSAASFVLKDLNSTNGTFVNGTRIREVYLKPGDTIEIGASRLKFEPRVEEVRIPPSPDDHFGPLYGKSLAMRQVFGILSRVSPTDTTILIQGETGTGKDLMARAIHQESARRDHPFAVFDCSSVSPDLVGSELFGHLEGAFTGAHHRHQGLFEYASGGTVFIDEIGELPGDVQPKLLRVLEAREVRPLGSNRSVPVDARVLAATHRDLMQMVRDGEFREDLYYRLAVVRIELPPLRRRVEDLGGLTRRLIDNLRGVGAEASLSEDALGILKAYNWPGNVRELRNVLERSIALAAGQVIESRDLMLSSSGGTHAPSAATTPSESTVSPQGAPDLTGKTLNEIEREVIRQTLEKTGGSQKNTAQVLGIHRNTLREKMKKYGLKPGDEI